MILPLRLIASMFLLWSPVAGRVTARLGFGSRLQKGLSSGTQNLPKRASISSW